MKTTTITARTAALAAALALLMACSPSNLPEPPPPTRTTPSVSAGTPASTETSSPETVTITATPPPVTVQPSVTVTEQTTEQQTTEPTAGSTAGSTAEPTATGEPIETATVKSVHDGDTFTLTDGRKVRVLGIDAPEVPPTATECYGTEATAAARAVLDGQQVQLQADPEQGNTDRYGRLLRYVQTPRGDLASILLAGGYAQVYLAYPVARTPEYKTIQQAAFNTGTGLWSACGE